MKVVLKTENNVENKIKIWIELGRALPFKSNHAEGFKYINDAITFSKTHNKPTLLFDARLVKATYELIHGHIDTALTLVTENQQTVNQQENALKADYYLMLGRIYEKKGDIMKVIDYLTKSLDLIPNSEKVRRALLMKGLSVNYLKIQDYQRSYDYLFKALTIAKETNNHRDIGICYNILGTQYLHQSNWEMSEKYYSKAHEFFQIAKDTMKIMEAGQNLAALWQRSDEYKKAISIYQENIQLAELMDYPSSIINSKTLIALCYNNLNEPKKALALLQEVKAIISDVGQEQKADYYLTQAEVLFNLKQYNDALKFGQLNYELSKKTAHSTSVKTALILLHEIHAAMGNYKKAYETHIEYKNISDTLMQQTNIEELTTQKLQLEFKEQQQLSENEKEMLNEKLKRQKVVRQFIILIMVLLALTAFLIYRYYKKQNALLEKDLESKTIIEEQANELQILYNNQNRFFTNIAHELRTPMTLIAAPISMVINENNLTHDTKQKLQVANRNVNHLKGLVNQILDLSKVDLDELDLNVSKFKLLDLITTLRNDFQPLADFQKIDFQTPININQTTTLQTDGEKLYIILKNILSNAFKFTNENNGKITFNCIELDDNIQISIQDNGTGISEEDVPNIFKRYFQSTTENIAQQGGTGIGLAICKEYMELLQGEISVQSNIGQGTSFILTFPKQLSNLPIQNKIQLSFLKQDIIQKIVLDDSLNDESKPLILVVEDNLEVSEYLQSILQLKYRLVFAHNGAKALEKLENIQPNLILSDIMMPKMNGFELVKQLKKSKKWQQIPIIILTALGEMTNKIEGFRIGIDDYLVKPFNQEQLQLRMDYLLKNQANRIEFLEEVIAESKIENDISSPKELTEDAIWLQNIENLVNHNLSNVNFNVYQLCLNIAMSRSHLYRKIKSLTGLTPKQYIDQIRYHHARLLLEKNDNISVKRIAYQVGFKDEKNFARNFKKHYGKYPSEYMN
ncbi:MAG: ATP-binding protein [Saprospiraceae bacterium]